MINQWRIVTLLLATLFYLNVSPTLAQTCDCSGDTYNCGDFDSQTSAQTCFEYCESQNRGDIHRLDGNDDGTACESTESFNGNVSLGQPLPEPTAVPQLPNNPNVDQPTSEPPANPETMPQSGGMVSGHTAFLGLFGVLVLSGLLIGGVRGYRG